jgi:hypothetical protein
MVYATLTDEKRRKQAVPQYKGFQHEKWCDIKSLQSPPTPRKIQRRKILQPIKSGLIHSCETARNHWL